MALAALAWCVSLLGDLVHPVLVRHVICMEHGEVLDAPEVVDHAHDTAIDRDPGGAHDPCAAAGAPPVVLLAAAHVATSTPLLTLDLPGVAHDAHPSLGVLVTAPKTSPPRS